MRDNKARNGEDRSKTSGRVAWKEWQMYIDPKITLKQPEAIPLAARWLAVVQIICDNQYSYYIAQVNRISTVDQHF